MNIYLSTKGQGDYNNSPPDIKTIDNGPIPDEIGYVLEMYLEIDWMSDKVLVHGYY